MTSKFTIFISHDDADEIIATTIKEFLEKVFLNANVYVAGSDMKGGQIWFKEIRDKLRSSVAIVSIITQFSEESPWVLFESGTGFNDERTIPLCADTITLDTLKPPLKYLQARELSNEGLQRLAADIAKRAQLRTPTEFHGISETIDSIKKFLQIRKRNLQNGTKKKSDIDPEIQNQFAELKNRYREVLIKIIDRASNRPTVWSREDLEKMNYTELSEIISFHELLPDPFFFRQINIIPMQIFNYELAPIKKSASSLTKRHAIKRIHEYFQELAEVEKNLK